MARAEVLCPVEKVLLSTRLFIYSFFGCRIADLDVIYYVQFL